MTRKMHLTITAALLVAALAARAETRPTPPDLPPTELARQSIDRDPSVIEARRAQEASRHGAAALRTGPNEWTTRVQAQQRRVDASGTSGEWTAALERTIRIGGKAEIDAQLGDVELVIAQARVREARHDVARALADLWLDALAITRQRELLTEQLSFAEASHQAVDTRRKAGDASQLDLNVAQADLIEVQRQLSAATTAEAKAKARLEVRFPALKYEPRPLADPTDLHLALAQWRERVLAESDPLRVTEGLLKRAELSAARSRADRVPDPTVGVYTASEAFRSERTIGLSVSIPLSGNYRSERMQQALREADAARAGLDALRRERETEVVEAYIEATGSLARWRLASRGLAAIQESARLTQRAYSLGEADLQTLLLSRRQALDASTAAEQARVEALRWHYRLLIDAYLIWALDEER